MVPKDCGKRLLYGVRVRGQPRRTPRAHRLGFLLHVGSDSGQPRQRKLDQVADESFVIVGRKAEIGEHASERAAVVDRQQHDWSHGADEAA